MTQEKREQGEFPRWYEAAVVSLELEKLCQQNSLLHTGEKADWDATDLRDRGIFHSVYGPALQMARQMDHIGRLDDNHLSQRYGELLLQGNVSLSQVPGALATQIQNQDRTRHRRRRKQGTPMSSSKVTPS